MLKSRATTKVGLALLLTTSLLAASKSEADTVALSFTGGTPATAASDQLYGWQFTANNAIDMTSLGVYDLAGDGLATAHDVGVFRVSDQSLLASMTIPAGSGGSLIGGFRYYALSTNLALTAGVDYVIAMTMPVISTDGQYIFTNPPTTAPEITYVTSRSGGGSSLAFPTIQGGYDPGMFGPNFLFRDSAAVPEPSSIVLSVIPAIMAFAAARRRSRRLAA